MNHPTSRIIVFLALSALLAACAPSAPATVNPQEVANQVAMTVASLPTQTAMPPIIEVQTATPESQTVQIVPDTPIPQQPVNPKLVTTDEEFNIYCGPMLEEQLLTGDIFNIIKLNSQLKVGDTAVVKSPVRLRTEPGLTKPVIVMLKPGNEVTIIGGPKVTVYSIGNKYIWWNVRLSDEISGWSAELSACIQQYFMEPVR